MIAVQVSYTNSDKSCSGIYFNSLDYINGKLSLGECDSLCAKIKLNHFFSGNYISVICKGRKTKLYKDSIFGYHNQNSGDYRFYKNDGKEYRIMEKGSIIIYLSKEIKRSSNGRFINSESIFYFSKTWDSPVVLLTVSNLKKAFPENSKFYELLDIEFGNGKDISEYYKEGNTFKVNYLLNQTNKQNKQ
jgi:hypothetical protein